MKVELHLIQNFAPSNLNRSDTGTPKDCEFGAVRRARISSQCLKRAIREYFAKGEIFTNEQKALFAKRTRLLPDTLVETLEKKGQDRNQAQKVVQALLKGLGLKIREKENELEYLVFLGAKEIENLVDKCLSYWDQLEAVASQLKKDEDANPKESKSKKTKEKSEEKLPKDLKEAIQSVLDGGRAADLALFGRMLADLPTKKISAASQVAHAISTHKVGVEFDFYTAVDDLQPLGQAGAGMMGTIEFNSACFYRYANIDVEQLNENLQGDTELAKATVAAFIDAAVHAIPTGKQNSMAAHNLPSFILVTVRPRGFWSLANAFVNPVKGSDIVNESIKRLDRYWGQLAHAYGEENIQKVYVNLYEEDLPNLGDSRVDNVKELLAKTLKYLETQ
ncbi:MAG: type I-E CRISPR-associated protein Cas7/Cse4/CasC [Acidobacteriota bacterium]|nr:type I-E CRISPR-associated protein Cas7/Cse4/CasC [Blastocatellia bacterium]MDW8413227.1 type I-E CRISPR-associated protein Cas7/Cse4/CasC [Acidobacteriota bacterium]